MGRFDREKAREALLRRTIESNERREGDASLRYFKADLDLPLWQARITKEDPHIIDIIPFVAGSKYPTKVDKRHPVNAGDYTYWLEVYAHQNVGPGKEWVVCPTRNYGMPCPICEEIDQRIKEGQDWEQYKDISPKRRCVYNIVCYDNPKEEAKGVQIWEVSYKYGEGPIQLAAKNTRGGGVVPFADPSVGKSVSFEVANDDYRTIQGHKLIDRDYEISEEVLDGTFVLDEIINLLPYDEIYKMFFGSAPEKAEDMALQKSDTEGSSDPLPSRRRRPLAAESKPSESKAKEENTCPHNGKFGIDIDELVGCGDCKNYDMCADEADKIEAERKVSGYSASKRARG